jgi:DNA-binding response OmpR family regulator
LADLKLPDLSGLEMIARFRESGYQGKVILISSYPDLTKPLDLNELNKSIDCLLNSNRDNAKRV